MKKWIIPIVVAIVLTIVTFVAFVYGEQAVAGWIMVGVDVIVVGGILIMWKKL